VDGETTLRDLVRDLGRVAEERGITEADLDATLETVREKLYRGRAMDAMTDERLAKLGSLAKWEQHWDMMGGDMFPPTSDWSPRQWAFRIVIGDKVQTFYGDTPKLAVKTAWKAWKEAHNDDSADGSPSGV